MEENLKLTTNKIYIAHLVGHLGGDFSQNEGHIGGLPLLLWIIHTVHVHPTTPVFAITDERRKSGNVLEVVCVILIGSISMVEGDLWHLSG